MNKKVKYIIGIDEAGRGPLAGPVAVGAVAALASRLNSVVLRGVKDSKKLSAKKRSGWEKIIKQNFIYKTTFVGPKIIDKIGITAALKAAVRRVIGKIPLKDKRLCCILLDGGLKAPKTYFQETIIKGDEKISLISAASIIAKTARDRKMEKLHKEMPQYCFNAHKGYGTKLHYKMIKKFGISPFHRKSYFRKFKIQNANLKMTCPQCFVKRGGRAM